MFLFFFFFSSRRRHTRLQGDWSSDVCSSDLYREPAEYFYGRCLRVDPKWAVPPGYITEATQRAGIVGQIGRAASLDARQKARATTQMEDIVDRGYVIIGSP